MQTEVIKQKNKIHPHKFTLWVGIGSIVMMFAGLTSAYIVKRNQAGWVSYELPIIFWYSTIAIVVSSVTVQLAVKAIKQKEMAKYRRWLFVTMLLGVLFVVMQYLGFNEFWKSGMTLQANVSFSFLYVIVGLHALHVIGGVMALMVMSLKVFSTKKKIYTSVPAELIATYWHFVDALWVYLLVFLLMIK
jgi:cytochrome c oxidase subunit 3